MPEGDAGPRSGVEGRGTEAGQGLPDGGSFLALAGALSGAVTPGEVAQVLADQARSTLSAESITVSLLDETGTMLHTVATSRSSPQVKLRFASYRVDGPYPTREALTDREPVLVRSRQERDRRYPALAGIEVQRVSWAVLPLVVEGRVLGIIGLGWDTPQTFPDEQVQALARVADMTAVAFSRAQRFDAEYQARAAADDLAHRLGVLQDLTGQLAAATDLPTVGDLAVGAGLHALSADAATIGLLEDQTFTALATVGVPADMIPRWSTHDVSDSGQVRDLLAQMRPVLITSRQDREARYPDRDAQDSEFEASATLALVSAGVPVGLVAYGWKHPRSFDQHDVDYLTAIASNTATAIDRCRLLSRLGQVAETLQRALLPEVINELPGWDLAACYVPAVEGTQVGGDWYDAFRAPDGRVVLVLGDVTGKGIHAAAVMGSIRSALRAYASLNPTPELILGRLDDYFAAFKPDEMATCAVAVLDPATGDLTYASAGHLPPLHVTATGTRWLDHALTPPLGASGQGNRIQAGTTIDAGHVLILYSDGLVERRDQDLHHSLQHLATLAAAIPDSNDIASAAADLIVQLNTPSRVIDDTAILILRRHTL
jgi:GAF domain-containing protein